MSRGLFKFSLALGSMLVALALAEVASRVWLSMRGTPYRGSQVVLLLSELAHRTGDALPLPGAIRPADNDQRVQPILHPYFGYDVAYGVEALPRDVKRLAQDPAGHYDVLVLGGSVAGIFATEGTTELARLLAADERLGGRPVRFMSYARGAYKQPQQLLVLSYLLCMGLEPEAVLNIDGFNEVAIGNTNAQAGTHPSFPSYTAWLPKATAGFGSSETLRARVRLLDERESIHRTARRMSSWHIERSALLAHVVLHRLERREHALRRNSLALMDSLSAEKSLHGPPFTGGPLAAVAFSARTWFEASRAMAALCESRGIRYVHVLQPTLHDPDAKPLTADERRTGTATVEWIQGVELGYPLLRNGGRLLREAGHNFLDCSRIFADVQETLYYDACHYRNPGSEILARHIAARFFDGPPE